MIAPILTILVIGILQEALMLEELQRNLLDVIDHFGELGVVALADHLILLGLAAQLVVDVDLARSAGAICSDFVVLEQSGPLLEPLIRVKVPIHVEDTVLQHLLYVLLFLLGSVVCSSSRLADRRRHSEVGGDGTSPAHLSGSGRSFCHR